MPSIGFSTGYMNKHIPWRAGCDICDLHRFVLVKENH